MPWKNGLGSTTEIALFPDGTSVAENNFTWRLSSAEITQDGPFSSYPGYQRFLTLLSGKPITLTVDNKTELVDQNSVLHFTGESKVHCQIQDKVVDLNFIIKKDTTAKLEIFNSSIEKLISGTYLVFVIQGSAQIDSQKIETFETAIVEGIFSAKLSPHSKIILISIG